MQAFLSSLLLIAIALPPIMAKADCSRPSCISGPGFSTGYVVDVCSRKANSAGLLTSACYSANDPIIVADTTCNGKQATCRFDFGVAGNYIEYIDGSVICYFEGDKNEVAGPGAQRMISNHVQGVNARMECVTGRRE